MKHAGAEHRVRATGKDALGEMICAARPARGNQRNPNRVAHRARQAEIEAFTRAVAIHAGEQYLARPRLSHALRPGDRVETGGPAPAVRVDLPAGGVLLGVDRHHDRLVAGDGSSLAHQVWILHRGRVDRDLVGAGIEQAAHVLDSAHAAADGERNKNLARHGLDHVQQDLALLRARGDVEKGELVGALAVIARGDFDRIAGVAQADKVDALDHAARRDVEAGNHPLGESHPQAFLVAWSAAACALFRSSLPSYRARPAIAPITPSGASFAHTASTSLMLFSPPEAMTGVLSCCASLKVASMLMPLIMPSRPISV